ncbi:MAG: ABC transporter permease [Thermoanaerobaculia bacterium]|nr:MAG: ABC transporter permease [Thermoanaerobaculia bacterium]
MTFLQALRDFAREALVGLLRSLRVSALAVLTIGVSLFLAGAFYLVSRNLESTVRRWRDEARFVVYVDTSTAPARLEELARRLRGAPWISEVEIVTRTEAERRFERSFPSLSDLVRGGASASLPASLEARLRPLADGQQEAFRAWVRDLLQADGVELVDDDRDWIGQIETVAAVVRALGLVLTAILIAASVFTIASVVRLTSYLYRDEIAVMRLVGATEFYIRGPFYFEGLFQGLLGALVALGGLSAVFVAIRPRLENSLVVSALAGRFLSGGEVAALLGLGALAGLVGAVLSLGREQVASERG